MTEKNRVVTANLPAELVAGMDEVGERIERSKSWIVREAVTNWLAEERRRYDLTLEALKDVEEGRVIPHEEVMRMVQVRKSERGRRPRCRPTAR